MMKMNSSLVQRALYGILGCSFMALLGFTWAYQEPPGLTNPTAIGPYLNRVFPTNYAEHQYQWNLVGQGTQTGVRAAVTYSKGPGTHKLGFGSTQGDIYVLDLEAPTTPAIHLGDVTPGVTYPAPTSRYGLRGLAFHPEYGQAGSPNKAFVYVTQVTVGRTNRLSRFTVSSQTGKIDLDSELIMVETVCGIPTFHSIHELRFDAEGYLYFAIGDGHPNNEIDDIMGYVQNIDNNLIGGVFRIDVDRDPTRSHPPRRILDEVGFEGSNQISGRGYYIPNDNPWVNGDGSVMEEYYSLGHRNPWKLSIDAETNTLWVSEVGPHNGEELNRIEKGYNYGWPYRVGTTGEIVWDRTPPEAPEPDPFLGELTGPVFSPPRAKA
ncbi:MAG: sorbosone dehydrogenase family protein, partial [Flavobacteriaceae bacterium]